MTSKTNWAYAQDGAIGMKMQKAGTTKPQLVERGATGLPLQRVVPQTKPAPPTSQTPNKSSGSK